MSQREHSGIGDKVYWNWFRMNMKWNVKIYNDNEASTLLALGSVAENPKLFLKDRAHRWDVRENFLLKIY